MRTVKKGLFVKLLVTTGLIVVLNLVIGCQTSDNSTMTSQQAAPATDVASIVEMTDTSQISPTPTDKGAAVEETAKNNSANADVVFVRAVQSESGKWTFTVTVSHPDTGWDDYADGWDVVVPDGDVLKVDPEDPFTRLLLHPHENEQPFTRSQSGIEIPEGVISVVVRAHDIVDGFGGREVTVDLKQASGPDFEVEES